MQNNPISIIANILPGWNIITNYEYASLERIWLLFDADIRMEVYCKSAQAIHCHTFSKTLMKYFFLSVVYGANSVVERKKLGEELCEVKTNMGEVPWMACGGFNTKLFMTDRLDYFDGMPCSQSFMDFRQCLEEVDLVDLYGDSPHFTWSNKRVQGFLSKKTRQTSS